MLRAVRQASADLVTRSMMRSRHKRSSSSLSLSWNHKDREPVSESQRQSHSANRNHNDAYKIHEGGELRTILNIFFQNTLDLHHLISGNLRIKAVSIKRSGIDVSCLLSLVPISPVDSGVPTLCMIPIAFILADSLLNSDSWCFPRSSSWGISSSSAFIKSITVKCAEAFQYSRIWNNFNMSNVIISAHLHIYLTMSSPRLQGFQECCQDWWKISWTWRSPSFLWSTSWITNDPSISDCSTPITKWKHTIFSQFGLVGFPLFLLFLLLQLSGDCCWRMSKVTVIWFPHFNPFEQQLPT